MTSHLNRIYLKPLIITVSIFILVNVGLYGIITGPSLPSVIEGPTPSPQGDVVAASPSDSAAPVNPSQQVGSWTNSNGIVVQQTQLNQDMLYGTGLIAERFTISLDIALPADNPNAGGGLLFHMAQRDDFAQSQMVRLADGGKTLLWGFYNEIGDFVGEGSLPLTNASTTSLKVLVRSTDYTIQINDVTVADNLPLKYPSGYVAYLSFSGPISFSNLNILLTS